MISKHDFASQIMASFIGWIPRDFAFDDTDLSLLFLLMQGFENFFEFWEKDGIWIFGVFLRSFEKNFFVFVELKVNLILLRKSLAN